MAHVWVVEANNRGPDFPAEHWHPLTYDVMGKSPICRTRQQAREVAKYFQESNQYNKPMLFSGRMITTPHVRYRARKYISAEG